MSVTAPHPVPEHLGKPLQVFTSSGGSSRLPKIVLALAGLVVTVGSLVGTIGGKLTPIVPLAAAAFTGVMGYLAFRKGELAGWCVVLCEGGLSSRDKRATASEHVARPRDLTWDQIVSVRTSMTRFIRGWTSTDYEYHILELPDGDTFDLTNAIPEVSRLAETVQEQVYRRVFPRAREAFQSGQAVAFGPISIGPQGLQLPGELVPWDDVAGVTVRQGQLIVQRGPARKELPPIAAPEVKNLQVLWTLLGEKLGQQRVG